MPLWLLLLATLARPTHAQEPRLRIESPAGTTDVPVTTTHGTPAVPATALETLGARIEPEPAGARILLFHDTLHFTTTSPFFRAAGHVWQLASAPYHEGERLFLPRQLLTAWIPAHYPDRVRYAEGTLRLLQPDRATTRTPTRTPTARVVILDPGHGGPDAGRIGPNGVREKDVTLAIARRLAAILRQRPGYEVHLTRTRDTLIALADRPRLANRWKAGRPTAVYLSIHANAGGHHARGFETFFLSEARTDDERRVAEMENAASAYETHTTDSLPELEAIQNGLRNDFYLRASNALAETVQRRLARFHPGPDRGVKQAGFRVLVGAFMPAVLVETAFLSHPAEARLLAASAFQDKIAWALADAIGEFFAAHDELLVEGSP